MCIVDVCSLQRDLLISKKCRQQSTWKCWHVELIGSVPHFHIWQFYPQPKSVVSQHLWTTSAAAASEWNIFITCSSLQLDSAASWVKYIVGHKKHVTIPLSISSPIIDRFSKFFHWNTLQTICNNAIIISRRTINASLHYLVRYKCKQKLTIITKI